MQPRSNFEHVLKSDYGLVQLDTPKFIPESPLISCLLLFFFFFLLDAPLVYSLMLSIMLPYLKTLKTARDFDIAQCPQHCT